MTVSRHVLTPKNWPRLPATIVPVTRVATLEPGRLADLVARSRGEGGLGHALSERGIEAFLAPAEGRWTFAWVAMRQEETIGAAALLGVTVKAVIRWSIPWVVVAPQARRSGVGTALVRAALEEAAARQADVVTADTLTSWTEAAWFWRTVAARLAD